MGGMVNGIMCSGSYMDVLCCLCQRYYVLRVRVRVRVRLRFRFTVRVRDRVRVRAPG